jgi:hypothetical protein
MFNETTSIALVMRLKDPAQVRIRPKTNVDKPKIRANVATKDKRSFHNSIESPFTLTAVTALIIVVPF